MLMHPTLVLKTNTASVDFSLHSHLTEGGLVKQCESLLRLTTGQIFLGTPSAEGGHITGTMTSPGKAIDVLSQRSEL